MKKFLLTLAVVALAASSMNAQTNSSNDRPEEPDRVQMRELSKNPTGLDVPTGIDKAQVVDQQKHECKGHKDGQACNKPADQQCDKCKAEAAKHECKKAEGQCPEEAAAAKHECKKAEGQCPKEAAAAKHECKKAEGQCPKEAKKADCCKQGEGMKKECSKPADQQCDKCKAEAAKKN